MGTFVVSASSNLTEYVGRGVDLFTSSAFGVPIALSRILVPVDALNEDNAISKLALQETNYQSTYADSFSDISHKLTVEAGLEGSYGNFSGSVKSKFGLTEERIEKSHFMKIFFNASGDVHRVDSPKKYLNDDFRKALAVSTADELFKEYGTHLINNVIIGGRAEFFCWSSDVTTLSEREFEIAAQAKYSGAGGSIEGSATTGTADKSKIQLVQGSLTIATIGGSAEGGFDAQDPAKWGSWVRSIQDKPGFLGFRGKLTPIWELTDDSARRAQIQQAYQQRAAKALRTAIFSVTSEIKGHPEARVTVPDGYKLVGGGARDNYRGAGNFLTGSFPENANTWKAAGKSHLSGDDASITAFAVAIYDPGDIWEVTISKSAGGPSDGLLREQSVPTGYVMVGGGAQVNYKEPGNMFNASYPVNSSTWRGHARDCVDPSPGATIEVDAIGLKCKVPGIKVDTVTQDGNSNQSYKPDATAAVAPGCVMTCGGAVMQWAEPGVLVTGSYPRDATTWEGLGKDVANHHCETVISVQCIGVRVSDA